VTHWCRGVAVEFMLGMACVVLTPTGASAQSDWLEGYLQTVPLFSGATNVTEGNFGDFSRFRLTAEPVFGPFSVEVSYEHGVNIRRRSTTDGLGLSAVPSGGEWFDLQWTVQDQQHARWTHRFDRFHVAWMPTDTVDVRVGRQAVSWGTTLFLTPADPFLPFSPTDPFRLYRGGVDAGRIRLSPSPLSEIDLVVRPTRTALGEEVTALGRGLAVWKNWELSAWGGTLYGDTTGAVGVAGSVGPWALRGEGVAREMRDAVVFRGSLGLDRAWQVRGRDFVFLVEYQRDNMAASGADEYLALLQSAPFQRGEYQVLGRDEVALQGSYQVHPLLSVAGFGLWNANDGSVLLSPNLSFSASNETTVTGGVYFGFGASDLTPARPLPSEYGLSGVTGYISVSWFF